MLGPSTPNKPTSLATDAPHAYNTPPRAPLLYCLLPLIAGILFAQWIGFVVGVAFWLWIGLSFGVLGGIWFATFRKRTEPFFQIVRNSFAQLFLFFGFTSYTLWMTPPDVQWTEAPMREVAVQMKVDRLFKRDTKSAKTSGLGIITEAPKHLHNLLGQTVFFALDHDTPQANDTEKPKATAIIKQQQWIVRGVLQKLELEDTGFDQFLKRNHVHYRLSRGQFVALEHNASAWRQFCERSKERLTQILCAGSSLENPNTAIYVAMLLGQQSALDADQKELFTLSGTIHLFAISGLHIAVIAGVLFGLLRLLRMPEMARAAFGLFILWMYVDITGTAPSAVRAFMMIGLIWGAHAVLRKPESFSALVIAACLSLLVNPLDLFNIGFQLSYAVVASIILYGVPLAYYMKSHWNPYDLIPEQDLTIAQRSFRFIGLRLIDAIAINLGAFLVSTPITLEYFQLMTPGALFTNLLLIPLSSIVISVGFFAIGLGLIGVMFFAKLLNIIAGGFIYVMNLIVELSMYVPGVYIKMDTLGTTSTFLVLFAILIIFYRWTSGRNESTVSQSAAISQKLAWFRNPQRTFLYAPILGLVWIGLCFLADRTSL
jgi:competence protein ComEC